MIDPRPLRGYICGIVFERHQRKETEWGRLIKQPDEIGGAETQSAYVIVADADALYARAKVRQAKIVVEIKDEDYGGRGFSCYDLEGHLWNFGTYDPW